MGVTDGKGLNVALVRRRARVRHQWMTAIAALCLLLTAAPHVAAAVTPGERPAGSPASLPGPQASTGLAEQFFSASGKIYVSVDASGTNLASASIGVNKKTATSTVRKAFLLAASTGFAGDTIPNGGLSLQGTGVDWDAKVASAIASESYRADVTSIVKPVVDAAPTGLVNLTVTEGALTSDVDGEVLVVVFDDPSQTKTRTIILLFGAQATGGDTFAVTLADPIDPASPTAIADFGLGISFGFQTGGSQQYSIVEVNSQLLTSAAGGEDDCRDAFSANGCLITAGGIGDSKANPADPSATPADPRSDDELYSLLPLITNATTSISVFTQNPSSDDNVFFAYFELSGAAVVGQGIVLSPDFASNPVGTQHTVTATVVNTSGQPIVGRTVTFSVISGPNDGAGGTANTDANGRASFTYSDTNGAGTDQIQASFIDDAGATIPSNIAVNIWGDGAPDVQSSVPILSTLMLATLIACLMVAGIARLMRHHSSLR